VSLTFRPSTAEDLPVLHRWLNEPGVVEWWEGDDVSWEGVVRDYGPDRDDGTEHWIAQLDGRDIGWIQCYAAGDSAEERDAWSALGLDIDTAAGIDYFLAEPGERGQGLGSRMIRAFLDQVVFPLHPEWRAAAAAPYAANVPSCRALEKAGFHRLGVVEDEAGPCHLYVAQAERDLHSNQTK
jgi:RimJ/RimL family protein N-acetyltransferase